MGILIARSKNNNEITDSEIIPKYPFFQSIYLSYTNLPSLEIGTSGWYSSQYLPLLDFSPPGSAVAYTQSEQIQNQLDALYHPDENANIRKK